MDRKIVMINQSSNFAESFSQLLLTRFPYLNKLDKDIFNSLVSSSQVIDFNNGNKIIVSELTSKDFIYIYNGKLSIYTISETGKKIHLKFLENNDFYVKVDTYFKIDNFELYLQAEDLSKIILIDISPILRLPYEIYYNRYVMVELIKHYTDLIESFSKLISFELTLRVAQFLLKEHEVQNYGPINLTHSQIANYLNSAREPVTRILNNFSKEDILQLKYKKIIILDRPALENLSADLMNGNSK